LKHRHCLSSKGARFLPLAAVVQAAGRWIGANSAPAYATGPIQVLSSSSWIDSIGDIHIVGEVQNGGSQFQQFIEIDFGFYNSSNTLLNTDFTFTQADVLASGERSSFEDIFAPPAGYNHYAISNVTSQSTSAPSNHNFTTTITNVFTDSIGAQHVVGTVMNNNSTTDTFVQVLFTMYDCSGGTIDSDFAFIQTDSTSTLGPNPSTANFALIRSAGAPAAVSLRAITQSSDAPSPYAVPAATNYPLSPPGPPSNVSALAGSAAATVNWNAPACAPGPINSYTVTASPGGATATVGGTLGFASVTGLTDGTTYTFTVTATNAVGTGPASAPSNAVVPGRGAYVPLSPARILDTRSGLGAPTGQVGPGGRLDVQITGQGGVPGSGVAAVVVNVTATDTTAGSYLTVWPTGLPRPVASNLNWTAGKTVPNLIEVAVGVGGKVSLFNAAGSTSVIFDVAGYVATPTAVPGYTGLYNSVVPKRVLDTRDGTGGVPVGTVGPGETIKVRVSGTPNIPSAGVAAVVLNVTVTDPTAPSYLTVFPTGVAQPVASNLNFVPGQTVPNRVIVQVGTNTADGTSGWVSFFNAAGSVNVIADVGGWFTDSSNASAVGSRFVGVTPARILDTRNGTGGFSSPLGAGQTIAVSMAGQGGVPAMNAGTPPTALVLNVTVADTTAGSYLTVWPDLTAQPIASDLNWASGLTVANLVVVKVGSDGKISLYNPAGSANVIIDVVGWYG
jgi:hypothetical protein